MSAAKAAANAFRFGSIAIPSTQVFLQSSFSYGMVNLKPIRPGHVLLVTRRPCKRFADLTTEEVADLFAQGQRASRLVEKVYKAQGLTLCVQDGAVAGQTVPHVHLHVIPRHPGDFDENDQIYEELEGRGVEVRKRSVDNDERKPRSAGDMESEARMLRTELSQLEGKEHLIVE
ncbi:hypothetical protein GGI07_005874 [Coemansia sp. Benny D115]|nr:hypothetical protein GGI07_005874 [Coemansia sp. Benny D115]